jgi:GNAT superfamily N-acetyltransferase
MILREAVAGERDAIVALTDAAFFDLPVARHLVPDPGRRSAVLRRYIGLHVDRALAHGTVHVAVHDGVVLSTALWYEGDDLGAAGYRHALRGAIGTYRAGRIGAFEDLVHQYVPATDHTYLGVLAVAPDRQSRGIGSLLLDYRHHQLDRMRRPAYLVACGERSHQWYLRHGYADTGHRRLSLPNGGILYRMWRAPRTPRPDAFSGAGRVPRSRSRTRR